MGKYFLVLLMFIPALCAGQAKIYTKKAKLADFSEKTTKVVISSSSILELNLKKEVTARWISSPYEFCTIEDYENLKEDNSYYFLRLTHLGGVYFLSFSKGGKKDDKDLLKRPVRILDIPIGCESAAGLEYKHLGIFLDIIQKYVTDSIDADKKGYLGLSAYNQKSMKGKDIVLDPDSVDDCLDRMADNTIVGMVMITSDLENHSHIYKLLIGADNHEIYFYDKTPCKNIEDAHFSKNDIRSILKRGGKIID